MGRGDRKSRQGKIWRGTNGKYRPKKRKRTRGKGGRGAAAPAS